MRPPFSGLACTFKAMSRASVMILYSPLGWSMPLGTGVDQDTETWRVSFKTVNQALLLVGGETPASRVNPGFVQSHQAPVGGAVWMATLKRSTLDWGTTGSTALPTKDEIEVMKKLAGVVIVDVGGWTSQRKSCF